VWNRSLEPSPGPIQEGKLKPTVHLLKWRRPSAAWTPEQAPEPLRRLPPGLRRKAVEIANGLLRDGLSEDRAIRIATAKARAWALQQQRPPHDEGPN
jgi:hypothetical protein